MAETGTIKNWEQIHHLTRDIEAHELYIAVNEMKMEDLHKNNKERRKAVRRIRTQIEKLKK